jgi:hypothetical protein
MIVEEKFLKTSPISFRYFKRYNEYGTKMEMWCYPEQKTFTIWFEQEFHGLFFPVAALRLKKFRNG